MKEALTTWILKLMIMLAPSTPWRETYRATAEAFATSAVESPLFGGLSGSAKTAALYVSLGWFEASLRADAEGDCTDKAGKPVASVGGRCPEGATPHAFCIFQIDRTNLAGLGLTRDIIQSDVSACVRAGNMMMHRSFAMCRSKPTDDRLAWYAAGGPTCADRGSIESRHRMAKASWLFRTSPPPDEALDLGYTR